MPETVKIKRKDARKWAMKLLFQHAFTAEEAPELINSAVSFEEFVPYSEDEYLKDIVKKTIENIESIDDAIAEASMGWSKNRISKTAMSIMRLSVAEMRYREDIPVNISINEAVELSKEFDADGGAVAFINGILNTVADREGLK